MQTRLTMKVVIRGLWALAANQTCTDPQNTPRIAAKKTKNSFMKFNEFESSPLILQAVFSCLCLPSKS